MDASFGGGEDILNAANAQLQRRQQTAENSARAATNHFTYVTHGVGEIVVPQPIMFDCVFLSEPAFTSGMALVVPPDRTNFYLPLKEVAVLQWITQDLLGSASGSTPTTAAVAVTGDNTGDPGQQVGYVGAFIYITVRIDQKTTAVVPPPNNTVIHHHLVFQGTAIKKIDASVQSALASDNAVAALPSSLGAQ